MNTWPQAIVRKPSVLDFPVGKLAVGDVFEVDGYNVLSIYSIWALITNIDHLDSLGRVGYFITSIIPRVSGSGKYFSVANDPIRLYGAFWPGEMVRIIEGIEKREFVRACAHLLTSDGTEGNSW